VDAVNVALVLAQPLLLTGEPGSGKTQLAYNLAWELGLSEPLKFEIKSTTQARDLLYTYDTLGRFLRDKDHPEPLAYLTYNALGLAILRAGKHSADAEYLPIGFQRGPGERSVVLIDEIDKASRDLPNDLLNEVEHMYFRVPELGSTAIRADPDLRPILVVTSNSDKDLPDAFLRRCIYYNIPFPEPQRLREIVLRRLGEYVGGDGFVSDVLEVFMGLREERLALQKKPSTAELLGWIVSLRDGAEEANPLAAYPELALATLSNLAKTADDYEKAAQFVREWIARRQ